MGVINVTKHFDEGQEMARKRASGMSAEEIAAEYGVSPRTVRNRIRAFRDAAVKRDTAAYDLGFALLNTLQDVILEKGTEGR